MSQPTVFRAIVRWQDGSRTKYAVSDVVPCPDEIRAVMLRNLTPAPKALLIALPGGRS